MAGYLRDPELLSGASAPPHIPDGDICAAVVHALAKESNCAVYDLVLCGLRDIADTDPCSRTLRSSLAGLDKNGDDSTHFDGGDTSELLSE